MDGWLDGWMDSIQSQSEALFKGIQAFSAVKLIT